MYFRRKIPREVRYNKKKFSKWPNIAKNQDFKRNYWLCGEESHKGSGEFAVEYILKINMVCSPPQRWTTSIIYSYLITSTGLVLAAFKDW